MRYQKCIYAFAIAIAVMTFSASNAMAQTIANGPYYAWPSWDQTLPSSTRFIVLSNFSNQAVLDRETGLVWERSPNPFGTANWLAASNTCLNRITGNRAGWRLPTINELASIFDPSATAAPMLPVGHPFTGIPASSSAKFWTATPGPTLPDRHYTSGWEFSVKDNRTFLSITNETANSSLENVWCVRGGLFVGVQ